MKFLEGGAFCHAGVAQGKLTLTSRWKGANGDPVNGTVDKTFTYMPNPDGIPLLVVHHSSLEVRPPAPPPSLVGTCWEAADEDDKFHSIVNYDRGYVNIGVGVDQKLSTDPADVNVTQYNYHLHVGWKDGADCGDSTTGGHYDPTRACGSASDALCLTGGQRQPGLAYKADSPDYAKCTTNQDKCEVGDLSGRSGKVSVGGTTLTSFYFPAFKDDFEEDNAIDSTRLTREPAIWSSLVMHCDASGCGARVGCAKYVEVPCANVEEVFVSAFGKPRR